MQKLDVAKHILRNTSCGAFVNNAGGSAWAPSNVALCKYWGKRDTELNLPVTSSLSISLGKKGSFTHIKQQGDVDSYVLNGVPVDPNSKFAVRLQKFLDLFRPQNACYLVEIDTNVPIAAGLASSACGFASLVLALNNLYDWRLSKQDLSILARLGSGSACRSLWEGFVEWDDSFGKPLECYWPEMRIGVLTVAICEKFISSRDAMQHTVLTSPLYSAWPETATRDLAKIKLALARKDFVLLGETAEANSRAMHAAMLAAQPAINYSLPETLATIEQVWSLRKNNIPVFFTQDAGPNLQLLFLREHTEIILQAFPQIDVVMPFPDPSVEQLIIVDDNDVEVDVGEKMVVHTQGKQHRAFSIFILRKIGERLELLMQQRAAHKYHSANLWSNTCCGHPVSGESVLKAAKRRLQEEMGFVADLHEIGTFHYRANFPEVDLIENELDHVLIGFVGEIKVDPNPNEVQNYVWIDLENLAADLKANPQMYSVWLRPALEIIWRQK